MGEEGEESITGGVDEKVLDRGTGADIKRRSGKEA